MYNFTKLFFQKLQKTLQQFRQFLQIVQNPTKQTVQSFFKIGPNSITLHNCTKHTKHYTSPQIIQYHIQLYKNVQTYKNHSKLYTIVHIIKKKLDSTLQHTTQSLHNSTQICTTLANTTLYNV